MDQAVRTDWQSEAAAARNLACVADEGVICRNLSGARFAVARGYLLTRYWRNSGKNRLPVSAESSAIGGPSAAATGELIDERQPPPIVSPLLEQTLRRQSEFADWVNETLRGERVDVCVAYDSYSLEALHQTRIRTGCGSVFDALEYPDYAGRSGSRRMRFLADETAREAMLAHDLSIARAADLVIVTTPNLSSWYEEQRIPVHVVRNCVEYAPARRTNAIRAACRLKETELLLAFVNTAFEGSGLDDIVSALPLVPANVHLAISGFASPGYRASIEELSRGLAVNNRVHFVGERDPSRLVAFRSGADLALVPLSPEIPNHRTCLPHRVFEAVMSRVPIICSDLPAVRSVLDQYRVGLAYDDRSPACIADTIGRSLARRADLRRATHRAARALCWEDESRIYVQAMAPLVDGGSKHVVFVANCSIDRNRRPFLQARTLTDAGHKVTVLARDLPFPSLRLSGCRYFSYDERLTA